MDLATARAMSDDELTEAATNTSWDERERRCWAALGELVMRVHRKLDRIAAAVGADVDDINNPKGDS